MSVITPFKKDDMLARRESASELFFLKERSIEAAVSCVSPIEMNDIFCIHSNVYRENT